MTQPVEIREQTGSTPEITDGQLVSKCLDGDSAAWEELVTRYSRRVYNVAYQFTGRHEEAEDLTQEIFLKIYRSLGTFDLDAAFLPWLIRVSKNMCVDHYRKRRRERLLVHGNWEKITTVACTRADPYQKTFSRERRAILLRALEQIPSDLKAVVILRDLQGLTYQEISESMDLPEGTVKSRLNRGRLELARFIRSEDRSLEKVAAVSGGWFRKAVRKRAAARAGAPSDV
jgi:RNA polymerase sigma-70 factor (ECF subfamily)